MKNIDAITQQQNDLKQQLADAFQAKDDEKVVQALTNYSKFISEQMLAAANCSETSADRAVLAGRGIRQLTSQEQKYWEKFIAAARSDNPKQQIANIDIALPETVFEDVMNDIKTEHPLLSLIDFVNTSAVTKWIYNTQGEQRAVWGPLNSEITKELSGEIAEADVTKCKLTAFMYISQDMLDLGPKWIDAYVRTIMYEAMAVALEVAIVDGTGKDEPIGMTRQVGEGVSVTDGVYPQKEAIAVTTLDPVTYGNLISKLTKSPNGKQRKATGLILVVNPTDYYSVVMPATTMLTPMGTYVNGVLPVPTTIIESVGVPEGKAVFGLSKRYFLGMGTEKKAKIEYSDEYKFLEDKRTYKAKLHGNGLPKDNNAFLFLDISNLTPTYASINTLSVNNTVTATAEAGEAMETTGKTGETGETEGE